MAINNATLTVARQSTNTSVVTDPSTYFSQNWPIGVSDIKVGDCIQITGSSDTDGNISAASVADGLIPNAQCPSPTPSTSAPGPSSGLTTNQIFVGAVTATSPTSITMAGSTNAVQVNLTSSTQLTMLSGITLADLKTGTCIVAAGINQGNGTLAARTVVMTKKGVKGC